jgi:hypothetical protein
MAWLPLKVLRETVIEVAASSTGSLKKPNGSAMIAPPKAPPADCAGLLVPPWARVSVHGSRLPDQPPIPTPAR